MTDFGPLIANPKSFLLGAAAQFGIYAAYFLAFLMGFNGKEAAAISIIGGADGPTAIFVSGYSAQTLWGVMRQGLFQRDRGGAELCVQQADHL